MKDIARRSRKRKNDSESDIHRKGRKERKIRKGQLTTKVTKVRKLSLFLRALRVLGGESFPGYRRVINFAVKAPARHVLL